MKKITKIKKWKEDMAGLCGLDYIEFQNVPLVSSQYGPVIDLKPHVLEHLAAKAVLQNRIPIRGKELKFFRKILGLSYEKFAAKLGLTSGTVFHWEKAQDDRLTPVNEIAVRALVAEELGIEISGKFSELLGDKLKDLKVKCRAG
jgi:DNA-binding transcriptional regulator YiaG